MKHKKVHFDVAILLMVSIALAGVLAAPTNAFGLVFTSPPFNSPPGEPGGDEDSGPAPEDRGEVYPDQEGGGKPIRDPETPGYSLRFPAGAVSAPVKVRIFNSAMPAEAPGLADQVGSPFFLGAWLMGEGEAIREFGTSIGISAEYQDEGLASAQEDRLRLFMYHPFLHAWIKLGGQVDIYRNMVSGFVSALTPFEDGSTLFSLGVDSTPQLQQVVDDHGSTTLAGPGFKFHVPPGSVEVGTHFEVTPLPALGSAGDGLVLHAIDIGAYLVGRSQTDSQHRQITQLSGPISIELELEAGDCAAGRPALVTFRDGRWVEMSTSRTDHVVTAETDQLGIFGVSCHE